MCDCKQECHQRRMQGNWDGKHLYQIIGQNLVDRSPYYHMVYAGHCMFCGVPLSKHYMFSTGATSKSLCEYCYQKYIVRKINEKCIMSGQRLPKDKLDTQYANPRDLRANILEGSPFDKWCILHEKVTKGDMSWLADKGANYRMSETEIFNAVFWGEEGEGKQSSRALPGRGAPALPPARHQKKIDQTDMPQKVRVKKKR